jgi:hypothetical protein
MTSRVGEREGREAGLEGAEGNCAGRLVEITRGEENFAETTSIHPHPFRRPDLYAPPEERTLVGPVPFAVTILTEVFFYFPVAFFIIYFVHPFNIHSATARTKGPLLFFPQP